MKRCRLISVLLIFILVCSVKYLSNSNTNLHYKVHPAIPKHVDIERNNEKTHCLLTACPRGNLGNQIWEYMSLYVVWKRFQQYGHIPHIGKEMSYNLGELFPNLTISSSADDLDIAEICEDGRISKWTIPKNAHLDQYSQYFQQNTTCRDIYLEEYSTRYEDILEFGSEKIKTEMRLKTDLVIEAQNKLRKISASFGISYRDAVFVGMHYRGNDYMHHLYMHYRKEMKELPEHYYYRRAMRYFKRKYEKVIFILISVDQEWLYKNADYIEAEGDVVINPYFKFEQQDKIRDLVLLSQCNHSIINYGTFGLTAAFLAGGTTFVYDLNIPLDHRGATVAMGISRILNNWFSTT